MKKIFRILLVALGTCSLCHSQVGNNALALYTQKPDSSFTWQLSATIESGEGIYYEIDLQSQTWQHIPWKHKLMLYFPGKSPFSETATLLLRHLNNRTADLASLRIISDSTNTAAAILYDVPNQPLFDGREEDDLQAYTFSRFIETGDETWPLLMPMVKSVIRAMDVIQHVSNTTTKHSIKNFILSGHSKRGHVSWLAAAADKRISGIIPVAIDILNSPAQLPHHLESFGAYNTPSASTTKLLGEMDTPRGRRLIEMIDPYSYRRLLIQPKLIVSATNDPFFTTDALNLYWDGLPGKNSILYLSNANHVSASMDSRVNQAAFAFIRAVSAGRSLPVFTWSFKRVGSRLIIRIKTDLPSRGAIAWITRSDSKDFRLSRWTSQKIPILTRYNGKKRYGGSGSEIYELSMPLDQEMNTAIFGEIEFNDGNSTFILTTQVYISDKLSKAR